jgi:hypothetical protein
MVRLDVAGAPLGVTESVLKLQPAWAGSPEQERFTAPPKAAFTDDTVTVMVPVAWPLVVEMVVGETAIEKSAGAAPTLATNASVLVA